MIASDAPGLVEPHVRPGLAGVGGFVDAVAHHIDIADRPGFAGARPDDVGIGRSDSQRANGRHGSLSKMGVQSLPPSVDFQIAARSRARIVGARIARHTRDRRYAITGHRAQEAKAKSSFLTASYPALRGRGERNEANQEESQESSHLVKPKVYSRELAYRAAKGIRKIRNSRRDRIPWPMSSA